jgi:uncharacterized membrane-anchored protein YhcB (DUF1043 family)
MTNIDFWLAVTNALVYGIIVGAFAVLIYSIYKLSKTNKQ